MTQVELRERPKFSETEIKSLVLSQGHIKSQSPIVAAEYCVGKGIRRADLVVLSANKLVGFEIKSDFDTLVRLRQQSIEYIKHFDKVILVTTSKHLKKALEICPKELGIWVVYSNGGVNVIRNAKQISSLTSNDLSSMLTKAEKNRLLRRTDQTDIGTLAIEVLHDAVKEAFRSRYSDASAKFWSETSESGFISPKSLSTLSRFAKIRNAAVQRELESARYWAEWNARAAVFFREHSSVRE